MKPPDYPAGLDLTAALSRMDGDEELLREVVQVFLDDCPGTLTKIRQAAEAGDSPTVERTAHSLKGSIANFGAKQAHEIAFRLETLGRLGEMHSALRALAELEAALEPLRAALAKFAAGQS